MRLSIIFSGALHIFICAIPWMMEHKNTTIVISPIWQVIAHEEKEIEVEKEENKLNEKPAADSSKVHPLHIPSKSNREPFSEPLTNSWNIEEGLITNPLPLYPHLAREMGMEGEVQVELHIDKLGKVRKISLCKESGFDLLDQAVLKTLSNWRLTPKIRGIKTKDEVITLTFQFHLTEPHRPVVYLEKKY